MSSTAEQYENLNDACRNHDLDSDVRRTLREPCMSDTGKGPFIEIFYAKRPCFSCNGIFVAGETHAKVGEVCHRADWQNGCLFRAMQGDFFSPNGEARNLIERLGLMHTSMSVGDVVVVHPPLSDDDTDELMNYIDTANVETWMVDSLGWKRLD